LGLRRRHGKSASRTISGRWLACFQDAGTAARYCRGRLCYTGGMDEQPKIAEPKSKPRRRWLQFSLRTLLIAVTLVGCALGWLGAKIQEVRRERAAVALVEKKGGFVLYDYQVDEEMRDIPNAVAPGPEWLHAIIGEDYFRHVRWVVLGAFEKPQATVTDTDLDQIKFCSCLEFLSLDGTDVTDDGLTRLEGMTQLKGLFIIATKVTDSGLEHLKGLRQLRLLELSVDNVNITEEAVRKLKAHLPHCQIVSPGTAPY
jgi:hypothetical protein